MKKNISYYKKKLDAVFSRYIRYRDEGQCYTCPKKDDPKYMQNDHFVPRQYLSVRYDEINCHCQCYACNMLYNGQPSRYAQRLRQDYGDEIIDSLERKRHETTKWYPGDYEEKIAFYTDKIKEYEISL